LQVVRPLRPALKRSNATRLTKHQPGPEGLTRAARSGRGDYTPRIHGLPGHAAEFALGADEAEQAIARATAEADTAGIHGPATTPWILSRVAALTDGRSVRANLALIENNAAIAAHIALELASG